MLTWSGVVLRFEADEPFRKPEFMGSMLRGALGSALKRVVCVMRLRDCAGCPLEHACVYTSVFETRPAPGRGLMTRYDRAPHPFVLVSPLGGGGGEGLEAGLRLFGPARVTLPFLLRAFEEAGARGFGHARVRHRLVEVRDPDGTTLWQPGEAYPVAPVGAPPAPLGSRVRLRMLSPLRMTREGRLLTPDALSARDVLMAGVRRLGLLAGFFGSVPAQLDFRGLKAEADGARLVDARLRWKDLFRRSARQDARLGIGGILGVATLDLGDGTGLREAFAWAPVIHLGKATSMGLGQVELFEP